MYKKYRKLKKLNTKRIKNPVENWANELSSFLRKS
jgi:hypothetical protein